MQEKDEQKSKYKPGSELYEYSVATILNNNWRVDLEKYLEILNEKAKEGWRLCTVHSNLLGKEALRIMGFGAGSVVAEDILIFERRTLKK